jgi:hypothetical protein
VPDKGSHYSVNPTNEQLIVISLTKCPGAEGLVDKAGSAG